MGAMGDLKDTEKAEAENEKGNGYDWLDREYIQKSLRQGLRDNELKIVDLDILPATDKGENYASVVHKCYAKDNNGVEHRLIIKCLPANPLRKKFGNNAQIFRKEIDMYKIIFLRYEEFSKEIGSKVFWPKYYYSTIDGISDTVVLKDAGPEGFVMRERRKGLDVNHLTVVLETLAKFHAFSVAMKLRNPDEFQRKVVDLFPELLYRKDSEQVRKWVEYSVARGSQTIKDWGGEKYKRISEKILEWEQTLTDEIADMLHPNSSAGSILNHGDCWVNNMLFKYANEEDAASGAVKPEELMFIDFQLVKYCSPAVDLSYLMVTSVTEETRRKYWDQLLENVYLKSFWNILDTLGHKGDIEKGLYTLDWLKSEIQSHYKYIFITAVSILKAILSTTEDAPDLETLTEDGFMNKEDPFEKTNTERIFQERCRGVIDYLDENGLFQ